MLKWCRREGAVGGAQTAAVAFPKLARRAGESRNGKMKFWRKPLDLDKQEVPHGVVYILAERCKGCAFCVEYCPREVLEMSREFNKAGYHPPYVKNPDNCVNCDLCEMLCPEFAIFCLSDEEAAEPAGRADTSADRREVPRGDG
jgi:2-oxoglutarate ferredoxin oxidoreductase subunit delta